MQIFINTQTCAKKKQNKENIAYSCVYLYIVCSYIGTVTIPVVLAVLVEVHFVSSQPLTLAHSTVVEPLQP